jgi:hypothetical protein
MSDNGTQIIRACAQNGGYPWLGAGAIISVGLMRLLDASQFERCGTHRHDAITLL